MHPRIADVAVVEIPICGSHNLDGEFPLLRAILRPDIETAFDCLPTNRANISQLLVLHVGSYFVLPHASRNTSVAENRRRQRAPVTPVAHDAPRPGYEASGGEPEGVAADPGSTISENEYARAA